MLMWAFPAYAELNNPAPGLFVDLTGRGGNTFLGTLDFITRIILALIGTVSIFTIMLGGFYYLTSGANPALAEKGKKMVVNSVMGLIIVILSYIIITVVVNTLTKIE